LYLRLHLGRRDHYTTIRAVRSSRLIPRMSTQSNDILWSTQDEVSCHTTVKQSQQSSRTMRVLSHTAMPCTRLLRVLSGDQNAKAGTYRGPRRAYVVHVDRPGGC